MKTTAPRMGMLLSSLALAGCAPSLAALTAPLIQCSEKEVLVLDQDMADDKDAYSTWIVRCRGKDYDCAGEHGVRSCHPRSLVAVPMRVAPPPPPDPSLPTASASRVAPPLLLPLLGGGELNSAALRGQVIVLAFWVSWQRSCRPTLLELEKLQPRLSGSGVEIVTVNVDMDRAKAEQVDKELGLTLPVALDSAGQSVMAYGAPELPTTYVIDRQGLITQVARGPLSGANLSSLVDAALAAAR